MKWYFIDESITDGERRQGPYSIDEIHEFVNQGKISDNTLVWHSGESDWKTWKEASQALKEDLPPVPPTDEEMLKNTIEALEQIGLQGQIAVVGIAKRLNEVYFPGDSIPLYIDKNSETLHVIQRLRDESHRFAITFHRKQRSKSQVHSALDDIPGIGPKTRTLLLKQFKSLKRIKEASEEELAAVVGPSRARALLAFLNQ